MLIRTLAVIALALPLLADDPMTRLRVDVKTLGGKPVERASVIVDFVQGRSAMKLGRKVLKHWETRTNQDGVARFPTIPQGTVTLKVIAKGYQTYGDKVELNEEEKTLEVKLNPPQPQHSVH